MKLHMNYKLLRTYFLATILAFIAGCTTPGRLQKVDIDGPINKTPIRIVADKTIGDIEVRPFISFTNQKLIKGNTGGHTNVNKTGIYEIEQIEPHDSYWNREYRNVNIYKFKGNNFYWNLPSWEGGIEFDLTITKQLALIYGLNYTSMNDENLWGNSFGLGYFGEEDDYGWRLDIIFKKQAIFYEAEYFTFHPFSHYVGSEYSDSRPVYRHTDTDKEKRSGLSVSVTWNTKRDDWNINYFINAGLGTQKLFGLPEGSTPKLRHMSSFRSLSIGIYRNMGRSSRLLTGIRIIQERSFKSDKLLSYIPDLFFQVEFLDKQKK